MEEDIEKTINQMIGQLINDARLSKKPEERLEYLLEAERFIFGSSDESLLDNFSDEVLEFLADADDDIQLFTMAFLVSAVEKDAEMLTKAVQKLESILNATSKYSISLQKAAIIACTRVYPILLSWLNQRRNDPTARDCWNNLWTRMKTRILSFIEAKNEGLRVLCIKFMEMQILCQTLSSEFSEKQSDQFIFNMHELFRDIRHLSFKGLETEAHHGFQILLDYLASSEITSLTVLAIVQVICRIARHRPAYMLQVISALESLHINLPPTLATNQVKSLRKELRYHLLRMLKHPATFKLHPRLTQLLTELGCSASEIDRFKPDRTEVNAALQRQIAAAERLTAGPSVLPATRSAAHLGNDEAPTAKRPKMNQSEFVDEGTAAILRGATDGEEDAANIIQEAIDMTTKWVYERLTLDIAVRLVTIALFTLPDEMPAAFQSSFTKISDAGTEAQKQNLARILAIQLNKEGEGPGIQYIHQQKQMQYLSRQTARMEGAAIPPTPASSVEISASKGKTKEAEAPRVEVPKRNRQIRWDLLSSAKEMLVPEAQKLCIMAFQRVADAKDRAQQTGALTSQHQLLVRLACRFHWRTTDKFNAQEIEDRLIQYIVDNQKTHSELALSWLKELYDQYQGKVTVLTQNGPEEAESLLRRYDSVLCSMLNLLLNRKDNKETLFHRILLEVPIVTKGSLECLRKACLDPVYGAFGMTTLRELILTSSKQRTELLDTFLEFGYDEPDGAARERSALVYDVREHCLSTAKELLVVDEVRDEFRARIIAMSEDLVQPFAPRMLVAKCRRITDDEELAELEDNTPWDEALIRSALYLFMSLLPVDPSLITQLASMTARATNEVKRMIFRLIEQAIKSIGMQSPELLNMIENCPSGAEPLVARIVHLLTERSPPTEELVQKVRQLHQRRNTDVRSLLPILAGLNSRELRELIPKFVMNATNSKSVPAFFRKLLYGRHISTHEPLMTPVELLVELHRCKPTNAREHGHLTQNTDLILLDTEKAFQLTKDVMANALELLVEEHPLPKLLYHTITKVHEQHPSLNGFLINILQKALRTHPDDTELNALAEKFVAEKTPADKEKSTVLGA